VLPIKKACCQKQAVSINQSDVTSKGVGRKISRGWGRATEKNRKIAKNDRKIALLSLFRGEGATEKRPKNRKKRPKNSTIKPLFIIFVPCLKI